jgi:hypothetical protein
MRTDRHREELRTWSPIVSCLEDPSNRLVWVHIRRIRHQTCQSFWLCHYREGYSRDLFIMQRRSISVTLSFNVTEILTNRPSRVFSSDHIDSIEEVVFEFLDRVWRRESTRDARDDNFWFMSLQARRHDSRSSVDVSWVVIIDDTLNHTLFFK